MTEAIDLQQTQTCVNRLFVLLLLLPKMEDFLNELKEKEKKRQKYKKNARKRAKYVRQSFCLVDGLKLGNNNDGKKLKNVRSSNISVSVAITNDLLSECHFNNVKVTIYNWE